MNKADTPLRFLYNDLALSLVILPSIFNSKAVSYQKSIEEDETRSLVPPES
jgi:hypothetical protein